MKPNTIEEVYELAQAIEDDNIDDIKKELGDLLLHIVFYAKIGEEKGEFNIASVINTLCEKLIARHPHIYGDVKVQNEEEVKQNWEKIKLKEGKKSVLSGVPPSLPAIVKALRLQDKTKQVGFEWDHIGQVKEKVDEELQELYEADVGGLQRLLQLRERLRLVVGQLVEDGTINGFLQRGFTQGAGDLEADRRTRLNEDDAFAARTTALRRLRVDAHRRTPSPPHGTAFKGTACRARLAL